MTSRAYDMNKRVQAVEGTRHRIAATALELFKERDFDAVSLKEIAEAAGVSHQTVLNHCGSKAGVLLAAGELFSEQVRELEADAVAGDVTSVVRTTCLRYEALGDANARWAAMSARAPEIEERLARGRLGVPVVAAGDARRAHARRGRTRGAAARAARPARRARRVHLEALPP